MCPWQKGVQKWQVSASRSMASSRPLLAEDGAASRASVDPVLCAVAAEWEQRQHAAAQKAQKEGREECHKP